MFGPEIASARPGVAHSSLIHCIMLMPGELRLLTVDQHVQTPVPYDRFHFRTTEALRPAHMPAVDWRSLQTDHS